MDISLSRHAQERSETRQIPLHKIQAALAKGDAVWMRRDVFQVSYRGLKVIIAADGMVITVYRRKAGQKKAVKKKRQFWKRFRRESRHYQQP